MSRNNWSKTCHKVEYIKPLDAHARVEQLAETKPDWLHAYYCFRCEKFHIGHVLTREQERRINEGRVA